MQDNPYLALLELELQKEYNNIRDREAIFWKKKSREKWVHDGDRNTKFFHLTTMVRRRRNKIDGLFNSNGDWCVDHAGMKAIAISHFENLFSPHE